VPGFNLELTDPERESLQLSQFDYTIA
jgi:hypothetical protein